MTTFSEPNLTKIYIKLQGNNSKIDDHRSIPVIFNHSQRYAEQHLMESIKTMFPEYDDKIYDIYHDNGAELDISLVREGDTLLLIPNVDVETYEQKNNQDTTPTINNYNDTKPKTYEGKNGGNLLRQGSSISDGITLEDSTDYTPHNTDYNSDDDLIVASDVTPMSNGLR